MRRPLLALLVLTLASPALAGPAAKVLAKPKPAAAALPSSDAQSFVLPAPIPLAVGRPGGDVQQCKATCAKTLYFCNSGGDDDGCASRWAQCNASCSATYTAPRFNGAR